MKIALLYFTGTYHTRYISELLCKKLINNGHQVKIINFIEEGFPNNSFYDLVGIGYPVHSFNAPQIVRKKMKEIPLLASKAFIYKVSGEGLNLNNYSSKKIMSLLKNKHYQIVGDYHFLMPYNIIFRFEDNLVKEQLHYADLLSDIIVMNIDNNKHYFPKRKRLDGLKAFFPKIQHPFAKLNGLLYRVNQKKCTRCFLCINSCPFNNISLSKNGKIKFSSHCHMCMRCSYNCPTNAINIGFMNNWKVNKPYDFKGILSNDSLDGDYVSKTNKRFYRCFNSYFAKINKMKDE